MTFETQNPVVRVVRAALRGAHRLVFETVWFAWFAWFTWRFVRETTVKLQIAYASVLVVIALKSVIRRELKGGSK